MHCHSLIRSRFYHSSVSFIVNLWPCSYFFLFNHFHELWDEIITVLAIKEGPVCAVLKEAIKEVLKHLCLLFRELNSFCYGCYRDPSRPFRSIRNTAFDCVLPFNGLVSLWRLVPHEVCVFNSLLSFPTLVVPDRVHLCLITFPSC